MKPDAFPAAIVAATLPRDAPWARDGRRFGIVMEFGESVGESQLFHSTVSTLPIGVYHGSGSDCFCRKIE